MKLLLLVIDVGVLVLLTVVVYICILTICMAGVCQPGGHYWNY